jgi:hypothetical protein
MPAHHQPEARERNLEGRGYVLVTAAYNEERHITETLRSVTSQTLLARRWVHRGCDDAASRCLESGLPV